MLDAAIQESLSTAIRERNGTSISGAGPSSSRAPTNKAAALRAQAAERRLGAASKKEIIDVSESDHSVVVLGSDESDFEEPLAQTSKKGKGKGNQTTKRSVIKRRQKKDDGIPFKRRARSKEEIELRRKLGRKLTPVRQSSSLSHEAFLLSSCRPRRLL